MSDIIIIITRLSETCEEGNKEWENIWHCCKTNWLAIFDHNYKKYEFNTSTTIEGDTIKNIKLVVFHGMITDHYGKLSSFICNIKDGNFLMAIHPGGGDILEETKKTLCNGMPNINTIIKNAIGYSFGCQASSEIEHVIAKFAISPSQDAFEKLRQFILNKKFKPHLIALSILCQGYLVAHGGNGLKGWDGLSSDLKEAAKNNWSKVKNDWWKPVFKTEDFEKTGVYNELKAMGKGESDVEYKNIKELFTNIGKKIVAVPTVDDVYKSLSTILKG